MTLRLLYDIYWWSTGPVSGRVVVRELLRAWREVHPQDEFVLAVRPRDRDAVQAEFDGLPTVNIHGRPHGVATLVQYGRHARRLKVDAALTQNFAPPGVFSATFIHDVMFQTNPEWFTLPERAYFWLIPTFARRADLVLTSSENEVARIRDQNPHLKLVKAIGLSVATSLTEAKPVRPAVAGGVAGFALTVGRLNVRKNLGTALLGALRSGRLSERNPLLVVGGEDGKTAELPYEVRAATDAGFIRFVPYVTDSELAWLYANADVFLYVALDEGFGLPPIEALHFGTPVVVSDIAVFHENLGSYATYVDPHDPDAIADALAQTPRERQRHPGLPTWHDCAIKARAAIVRSLADRAV